MRIKMLNDDTINKIAAGEVIIRPASVVKELVENAIDSGATRINVAIMEGGTRRIIVSDNGCGIPVNEICLAFERHSTSKILTIDDLSDVKTLGFRGEALASIVAVSKLTITTRSSNEEIGSTTVFQGGHFVKQKIASHDRGTIIDVRDLFYNIPARHKQMGKKAYEASLIRDLLEKLALSHPEIAFTYINDEKKQFTTIGNGKLSNAIEVIMGRGFYKSLIPFEVNNTPMYIHGFIGDLSSSRATRDMQIFFINGRYVRIPALSKAFEEAYEGYLMQRRYPVGIIFIELPGKMLDVNIHPAKTEIAILNQSLINILFKQAIRQTLKEHDLSFSIFESFEKDKSINNSSDEISESTDQTNAVEVLSTHIDSDFDASIIKPIQPVKKYHEQSFLKCDSFVKESEKVYSDDYPYQQEKNGIENKELTNVKQSGTPKIDFKNAKIIGQLFSTYIVLEQGNEAILIDQHAAHEAFMFEELSNRFFQNQDFPSQTLITPMPVSVTPRIVSGIDEHKDEIKKAGFECDSFGKDVLLVRAVPIILGEPATPDLIKCFLEPMFYDTEFDRNVLIRKIISMSCKSAIKGNNSLSKDEIQALLISLSKLKNPFTCPHGRPIIFRFKQYDIEKLFKRAL